MKGKLLRGAEMAKPTQGNLLSRRKAEAEWNMLRTVLDAGALCVVFACVCWLLVTVLQPHVRNRRSVYQPMQFLARRKNNNNIVLPSSSVSKSGEKIIFDHTAPGTDAHAFIFVVLLLFSAMLFLFLRCLAVHGVISFQRASGARRGGTTSGGVGRKFKSATDEKCHRESEVDSGVDELLTPDDVYTMALLGNGRGNTDTTTRLLS